MNPHYALVALRAGHRCEYCHAPEAIFNFPFEVEHVVPASAGGTDDDPNLALACRACNCWKGAAQVSHDPDTETSVQLFNPRGMEWTEHFRVDTTSGHIAGTTSVGRATVALLRLNGESQVQARLQWIRLGLFP